MSIAHLDDHRPNADGPGAPEDLIAAVRETRARADAAEADLLRLGLAWAHTHLEDPADDTWHAARSRGAYHDGAPHVEDLTDPGVLEWFGLPRLAWDAPAAFAVANQMTTTAGRAYLRDALTLAHRLPRVHARVLAGQVPVWRARRIAQAVLGKPADVAAYVDLEVAERAHQVGATTLEKVLDEAMLRLYPEQREAEQLEALDHRHATVHEGSLNHTGVAEMTLRADWSDLTDFDRALSLVAVALLRDGCTEPLDVRRAMAIGILADPPGALALINGDEPPAPTKAIVAYLHLSGDAPLGCDPVATDETGRTWLVDTVREWLARNDRFVTVRPVIDLTDHCDGTGHSPGQTDPYTPSPLTAEKVRLRDLTCVFPWCTRPARACDLDHITPYDHGGPTCECNLAALCRYHHRLKTHAGWTYRPLAPGTYLWHDPHGQRLLTTPQGTTDLTYAADTG
ncbi:HNH endonuclease signature motif containing protein [Nocardioides sp. cx-173]|uniref:HNH endonuclease signature motif containing protein n=1 Tax=Nocardioides sp. cx-173 TaxID=2898796 RepID=UPI001E3C9E25|nr:HNH endonuclease signature motif containing protein [Nocardioides sp. cx-173]MCD4524192.1 HNH endonuclease [Nocardioides sp. cx-173]UGB41584.1 HNH endonuclease [Nocardioides sp. cx-173]